MTIPTLTEQVRWQDLRVRSEVDIVFEIAKDNGWEDCEVFGYGDMITEPQESVGWKLIPADIYKYSIPIQAVARLHQIINAGIRVQGVIIADDGRRTEAAPTAAPAKRRISLPSLKPILSWIGNAFLGFIRSVGAVASFSGKALLTLARAAGVILLVACAGYALIHFLWPTLVIGFLLLVGSGVSLDPKLIVLVDDGNGGTAWISLYTWYD